MEARPPFWLLYVGGPCFEEDLLIYLQDLHASVNSNGRIVNLQMNLELENVELNGLYVNICLTNWINVYSMWVLFTQ